MVANPPPPPISSILYNMIRVKIEAFVTENTMLHWNPFVNITLINFYCVFYVYAYTLLIMYCSPCDYYQEYFLCTFTHISFEIHLNNKIQEYDRDERNEGIKTEKENIHKET